MFYGLPVVCFNLGGPGQIVNETCGFNIEANRISKENIISVLADCMIKLAEDSNCCLKLSKGAKKRVQDFHWKKVVPRMFQEGNEKVQTFENYTERVKSR